MQDGIRKSLTAATARKRHPESAHETSGMQDMHCKQWHTTARLQNDKLLRTQNSTDKQSHALQAMAHNSQAAK